MSDAPTIVLTVAVAAASSEPEITARKNALYAAAVTRHGGLPVLLDATSDAGDAGRGLRGDGRAPAQRRRGHRPARYGRPVAGATDIEPDRDALEAEAWAAAAGASAPGPRDLPRDPGDQRVRGRDAPPARRRPCRARLGPRAGARRIRCDRCPGSRLARILFPTNPRGDVADRQLVPPPGRPGDRPRPGTRRERLGVAARPATSSRASKPPTAGS